MEITVLFREFSNPIYLVCVCVCVCVKSLSRVRLFVTPWAVAYQAPPFTEFSRQEYWSGLPYPKVQQFHFWLCISKKLSKGTQANMTLMFTAVFSHLFIHFTNIH